MTPAPPSPASAGEAAAPVGTIHDLGYKRYVGTRMPQATRWQVIMRQQLAFAWKTWWRFKAPMIGALIATVVGGAVMFVWADTVMGMLGRSGAAEAGPGAFVVRFVDGIVPLSVTWYAKLGFITSLTIAAQVVATDLGSGALTFYFARPVRPLDYVLGKAAGLVAIAAVVAGVGPVLLTLVQLGLSSSTDELLRKLPNVGYALVIGASTTAVYSLVPLGFSALVADRRWAVGVWAIYYIAFGSIVAALGTAVLPPLAALDLPTALQRVSMELFDVTFVRSVPFSFWWGLGSIALHCVAALALVSWRLAKTAHQGVGGGS